MSYVILYSYFGTGNAINIVSNIKRDTRVSKLNKEIIVMKKKIITVITAASLLIGVSAMNASAWNHMGYMPNGGHGMVNGANVTDNATYQKFLAETKETKIAIAADQAELSAVLSSSNPDNKRIRELSKNIATNQLLLEEKSQAYGFGYNGGHMRGYGMQGHGNMNGGYYGGCMW